METQKCRETRELLTVIGVMIAVGQSHSGIEKESGKEGDRPIHTGRD